MNSPDHKLTFYDLTELSLVSVSGDDTDDFLQGQLSNDIDQLDVAQPHQLSAYSTPKGRVLALFHVLKQDTGYLLIAPREIMNKVLPRLRMYVMRAKVVFTPEEELKVYGMQSAGKSSPISDETLPDMHVYPHCLDTQRHFIVADKPPSTTLRSNDEWNALDISQNLPQVFLPLYEVLIPQSLNLDLVGAVNFKKGCYPGQEIIARIKYRGKPKTRMISARFNGKNLPKAGDLIYIDEKDASAGHVVSVATENERYLLCITLPVTHIQQGDIYLDEERTAALVRLEGSYEVSV